MCSIVEAIKPNRAKLAPIPPQPQATTQSQPQATTPSDSKDVKSKPTSTKSRYQSLQIVPGGNEPRFHEGKFVKTNARGKQVRVSKKKIDVIVQLPFEEYEKFKAQQQKKQTKLQSKGKAIKSTPMQQLALIDRRTKQ